MGYHPRPQSTMVATKVLISLCVYGLTAAAPQLGQNLNQEVIVNDVVTALQPSIAAAVANALRGLSSSSVTGFNSGSAGFSGSSSSTNSGFSSNSGFAAGGSFSGSAGAGGAALEVEDALTRPEYNFQFNVADDDSQTYITQQENRDGDAVTGTYSYVDPSGALVTVNYEAGPMGYSQTVDTQEGFVAISEENKAKINNAAAAAANNAAGFSSSTGSSTGFSSGSTSASKFAAGGAGGAGVSASQFAAGGAGGAGVSASKFTAGGSASKFTAGGSTSSVAGSAFGSNSAGQQVSTVTTTTSGLDQEALIAQILAVLQPQISSAVNTAVRQQQSTTTTSARQTALTGLSFANRQTGLIDVSQQVTGDRLTPLFGN